MDPTFDVDNAGEIEIGHRTYHYLLSSDADDDWAYAESEEGATDRKVWAREYADALSAERVGGERMNTNESKRDRVHLSIGFTCYGLGILCGLWFGLMIGGMRSRSVVIEQVSIDICNEIEVRTQYEECVRNVIDRYKKYSKPEYNSMNKPSDDSSDALTGEELEMKYKGVVP